MNKTNFCILASLLLMLLLVGCIQVAPSRLVRDASVTKMFASSQVLPGYKYYYSGSKNKPVAIIAVDEQLELVSTSWSSISSPEQDLADIVAGTTRVSLRKPSCQFYGAVINTPDQTKAGYWYAKWHLTSIRFPEPGKIEIFPPAEPTSGPCSRGEDR